MCGDSGRSARRARSTRTPSRLRGKLSARGERFVVNVWGVGYRLVDGVID